MAIAVPLFVGALNNAEETVKNANVRAVRGAAAASIVLNGGALDAKTGTVTVADKATQVYKATADVTETGELANLTITADKKGEDEGCVKDTTGAYKYKVTVYLSLDDLTDVVTGD